MHKVPFSSSTPIISGTHLHAHVAVVSIMENLFGYHMAKIRPYYCLSCLPIYSLFDVYATYAACASGHVCSVQPHPLQSQLGPGNKRRTLCSKFSDSYVHALWYSPSHLSASCRLLMMVSTSDEGDLCYMRTSSAAGRVSRVRCRSPAQRLAPGVSYALVVRDRLLLPTDRGFGTIVSSCCA